MPIKKKNYWTFDLKLFDLLDYNSNVIKVLSSLNDNEQKQSKSGRSKKSVEKSQGEQNQHDLKELDLAEIRRIQYAVQKVISYHLNT